jgi:hypothetical protein
VKLATRPALRFPPAGAWGLALAVGATSCLPGLGAPPAPPPRTLASALREPSSLLPRDLDVVIRVDADKIRSTLGLKTAERLAAESVGVKSSAEASDQPAVPGGPRDPEAALAAMLAKDAKAVWVGFRGHGGDSVLVAKGEPTALDPDTWSRDARTATGPGPFARKPTTEPGFVWFDRREKGTRTQPARLLWLGAGALAAISPGEIDAIERVVRSGGDGDRLRPREDAVLSFALRGRALRAFLATNLPEFGAILTKATDAEGGVDLEGGEVRGDVTFAFENSAEAESARASLDRLLSDLRQTKSVRVRLLARAATTSLVSSDSLRLRLVLPGDVARAIVERAPEKAAPEKGGSE